MGWRSETIGVDDTLQSLALRYLGHARHWPDIAALNGLSPPYLATTPGPGVLAYGDDILLPIAQPAAIAEKHDPFLTDIYLSEHPFNYGQLTVIDGDIALTSNIANFTQALSMRVVVPKRSMLFHPGYGCFADTLIGRINRASLAQLAAFYVKSALLEDPRVSEVKAINAVLDGDQIRLNVTVLPHYGEVIVFDVRV